jgi:hypothetical protein
LPIAEPGFFVMPSLLLPLPDHFRRHRVSQPPSDELAPARQVPVRQLPA